MAREVILSNNQKRLVVSESPNINKFTNTVDIYANNAVEVTQDLPVDQIDQIVIPPLEP